MTMKNKSTFFIIILIFSILKANAQVKDGVVQFSGVVVSADSLKPVPYANIMVKGTSHGTVSDFYGFFSFVAKMKDVIVFSSIGHKKAYYTIPDTLTDNKYSLIQVLSNDTFLLKETVIHPWPSREQFKEAFLNLRIPEDDMTRAQRNLERAELKERLEPMPMDGRMNQAYAMKQESSKLYYAGQLPPNNLLNPIAWAEFIRAWQNGDFKRKK